MRRCAAIRVIACVAVTMAAPAALAQSITAVEYYHPTLDHFFVSALAPEVEALDTGRFTGWYRTGQSFQVFPTAVTSVASSPVCRFYIPPEHGDSHFFSASPAECAAIAQRIGTDPNYSGYVLESPSVFYVALPDTATGACPAGTSALYRLWNQRADSNHRYTADPAIKAQMIAAGYVAEGYGPDAVAMCVPPSPRPALVQVSSVTPFTPNCQAEIPTAALFANAEVEPRIEVDPTNRNHLIGVWQQDRWADGGARGLITGVSLDGGQTWARSAAAFSRCTGGAAVGANYARASDPWITISPDGTAHQIAIAFSGPTFGNNSSNAVLVSRSTDGGFTWSPPTALIRDARVAFNDKESITADPLDARYVYAVWDRLAESGGGPTWFARTTDGGLTWEPARPIYDPGTQAQTLNNQIIVLPDGTLVNFFTLLSGDEDEATAAELAIIRSTDRGNTWSAPLVITPSLAIRARDPDTGQAVRDAANIGSIAVGRDGRIAVVWQDSRFSGGARDAIAFTQSIDGGFTWSPPVRINAAPNVQAFLPTVKVRDDGVIGVTYYDFRNNTPDPNTLPTDYWLTQSSDGVTWRETHVAGPFDLAVAPVARGLFIGDYQGLASTPTAFIPLFAQTTGDLTNPTDIFAGVAAGFAAFAEAAPAATITVAVPAPARAIPPEWRGRLHDAARDTIARRWRGPPPESATR